MLFVHVVAGEELFPVDALGDESRVGAQVDRLRLLLPLAAESVPPYGEDGGIPFAVVRTA